MVNKPLIRPCFWGLVRYFGLMNHCCLRTVKGIDCLGRGGIQALGKRLANASPLRRAGGQLEYQAVFFVFQKNPCHSFNLVFFCIAKVWGPHVFFVGVPYIL